MILVHDLDDYLGSEDLMALCHLDYAIKETGGEIRDLDSGVAGLQRDERLHVVGHGGEGSIVKMDIGKLANTIKSGIQRTLSCSILVTTCYAGSSSGGWEDGAFDPDNVYDSVLKQLARELRGWTQITLYGYRGPTITNANMNPKIAFVPADKVPKAGAIQNYLLRHQFQSLWNKWTPTSHSRRVKRIEYEKKPQDFVAKAAQDAALFYQTFYERLKQHPAKLLATEQDQIATVDILG